jgi:hypothetical protein
MTCLGAPEVLAAGIVVEQIGNFIRSRPARKSAQWDEASQLRNLACLLSLGGLSSYTIGGRLGLDPRNLRRKIEGDLDAIERRFGNFCKKNKDLRRKMCYTDDYCELGKASAAAILAGLDPDFDDLTETLSGILFD